MDQYRVMWKEDPPETREAASVVKYADAVITELEAENERLRYIVAHATEFGYGTDEHGYTKEFVDIDEVNRRWAERA